MSSRSSARSRLAGKDVLQGPVIALGPEVVARGGIDQLRRDPYLLLGLQHTAFQYIPHAHLPPHVLHLHRLAFVGESGVAGDDKETGDLGEITGEDFGEAVAEVVLLGSPLMLSKGSTTMEGLSGKDKVGWESIGVASCDSRGAGVGK